MTQSVLHLIHRAGQAADDIFASRIKIASITARQAVVLEAIATHDEPSQTDLVLATGIDRSTMADIVRRLSKNKLISRRRTRKDARKYAVRLTEKGESVVREAVKAVSEAELDLMSLVPAKSRSGFVDGLRSLASPPQTLLAAE